MNGKKISFNIFPQEILINANAVQHIFIPYVPEAVQFGIAQLPSPALPLR
jgi:hypothetical protein